MADSVDRQILARIVTVLAGINATGSYVYDVSATDRVQVGHPPVRPPRVPCLFVWWNGETTAHGEVIGGYRTTSRIGIAGYVGFTTRTPAAHTYAAMDLKADIVRALETDRRLNNLVYDLRLSSFEDLSAEAIQLPAHVALVGGEIEVWRERDAASP